MLLLSLPPDIQNQLTRGLLSAGRHECGGILMGEHVGENHFVVRRITLQRKGTFASFIRELSEALAGLRQFFIHTEKNYQRFNYLGEWHSHPSFVPEPSGKDHSTMLELITDPEGNATFLVLLIVKLNMAGALESSVHTYLPDGKCHRSTLQLEIPFYG
jgi:integrative and conjugative element protein (TIGR02256 family)